ncbi:phosphonate C-P lyase system protein PhnK, partial [Vibrio alfacsensis]
MSTLAVKQPTLDTNTFDVSEQPLLSVRNLTKLYAPGKGFTNVSFDLYPGEVLGIVGESG